MVYEYVRAEQDKRALNFGAVGLTPNTRIFIGRSLFKSDALTSLAKNKQHGEKCKLCD